MATFFEELHINLPPDKERQPYDPARHDSFAQRVPPSLAHEWREFGFGSYGKGLLWSIAPDEPLLDTDDWKSFGGKGVEVFRIAFGDVLLWLGGCLTWVDPIENKVTFFSDDIVGALGIFSRPDFRKYMMNERYLRPARKSRGALNKDQCYCFGWPPVPGIKPEVKDMLKVSMRDYHKELTKLYASGFERHSEGIY